jgi:hypothetical protein
VNGEFARQPVASNLMAWVSPCIASVELGSTCYFGTATEQAQGHPQPIASGTSVLVDALLEAK